MKGNLFMNLKFNNNSRNCQVNTDVFLKDDIGWEEKQRMTSEQYNEYASLRGLPLQPITVKEVPPEYTDTDDNPFFMGADMSIDISTQPIEWVLEKLIKSGEQTLITGAPKAGKSRLAVQLGVALATGKTWLGYTPARPIKILYINFEMGEQSFCRCVVNAFDGAANFKKHEDMFFHTSKLRMIDVLDNEKRRLLMNHIEKLAPDFIFWDTLVATHQANEQSSEMRSVMLALRLMSGGVAHAVIHHTRKIGREDVGPQRAHDARGSGSITAEADNILTLSRNSGQGATHTLTFTCRDVATPDDLLLNWNNDTAKFSLATEEHATIIEQAVRSAFKNTDELTSVDLKTALGSFFGIKYDGSQVKDYTRQAVVDGLIIRLTAGRKVTYKVSGKFIVPNFYSGEELDFNLVKKCN